MSKPPVERSLRVPTGAILSKYLRSLALDIETTNEDGDPITKAAALAALVWKHALGFEEPPEDKEPESAAPTSAPEPVIPRGRPGPKPGTRKAREEAARTSAVNPFPDIPPEATTTAAPQEQQPAAQPQTKSQNLFRF